MELTNELLNAFLVACENTYNDGDYSESARVGRNRHCAELMTILLLPNPPSGAMPIAPLTDHA